MSVIYNSENIKSIDGDKVKFIVSNMSDAEIAYALNGDIVFPEGAYSSIVINSYEGITTLNLIDGLGNFTYISSYYAK